MLFINMSFHLLYFLNIMFSHRSLSRQGNSLPLSYSKNAEASKAVTVLTLTRSFRRCLLSGKTGLVNGCHPLPETGDWAPRLNCPFSHGLGSALSIISRAASHSKLKTSSRALSTRFTYFCPNHSISFMLSKPIIHNRDYLNRSSKMDPKLISTKRWHIRWLPAESTSRALQPNGESGLMEKRVRKHLLSFFIFIKIVI